MKCLVGLPSLMHIEPLWWSRSRSFKHRESESEVLKIEELESESELLCADSTALIKTTVHMYYEFRYRKGRPAENLSGTEGDSALLVIYKTRISEVTVDYQSHKACITQVFIMHNSDLCRSANKTDPLLGCYAAFIGSLSTFRDNLSSHFQRSSNSKESLLGLLYPWRCNWQVVLKRRYGITNQPCVTSEKSKEVSFDYPTSHFRNYDFFFEKYSGLCLSLGCQILKLNFKKWFSNYRPAFPSLGYKIFMRGPFSVWEDD
jgi:hypothetical protein